MECSFQTKLPKFNREIISAVRDFPPGSGHFAQLNYLRPALLTSVSVPTESLASGDKNGDGHAVEKMMSSSGQVDKTDLSNSKDVGTEGTIESVTAVEHEVSEFSRNLHQLNNLRPVEEAASVGNAEHLITRDNNGDGKGVENLTVSTDHVDETGLINSKAVGTMEINESVTALKHEIPDFPKNLHELNDLRPVNEAASVGTAEKVDQTVLMTGMAFGAVETDDFLTTIPNEIHSLLKSPGQLGVANPKEDIETVLSNRNLCSPPDGSISVSNGNDIEITAANEFSRKVVSAIRNFPHLCGPKAALKVRNFGQESSRLPSSSNSMKTNVKPTGEKCLDKSYSRKQLHEERKKDFESSEAPSNRRNVLGLMAASNCPWRKGKGSPSSKPIPDGRISDKSERNLILDVT
ncbi:hypothetical protein ACFX19_032568 [Malus domestica]